MASSVYDLYIKMFLTFNLIFYRRRKLFIKILFYSIKKKKQLFSAVINKAVLVGKQYLPTTVQPKHLFTPTQWTFAWKSICVEFVKWNDLSIRPKRKWRINMKMDMKMQTCSLAVCGAYRKAVIPQLLWYMRCCTIFWHPLVTENKGQKSQTIFTCFQTVIQIFYETTPNTRQSTVI